MDRVFPDYIQEYLVHLAESGRESSTLKQYSSDIDKFLSWLNVRKGNTHLDTLRMINAEDIKQYIDYLEINKFSDATIRRLTSVLKRLFKHFNIATGTYLKDISKSRPIRDLEAKDFVSDKEYEQLLSSMKRSSNAPEKTARDYLIDRNVAIVTLIRFYGLTPSEVAGMEMNHINLARRELAIFSEEDTRKFELHKEHVHLIADYLNTIDKKIRPRYRSSDPLFVAFNNLSLSFQFDYDSSKPKDLCVRSIQEMIKDEVRRAGIRKLSAVNFRNSCIFDYLAVGHSDTATIKHFGLSGSFSLHRYKTYSKRQKASDKPDRAPVT